MRIFTAYSKRSRGATSEILHHPDIIGVSGLEHRDMRAIGGRHRRKICQSPLLPQGDGITLRIDAKKIRGTKALSRDEERPTVRRPRQASERRPVFYLEASAIPTL